MQARGRDRNRWGKESAGSCSQGKENVRGALPALTPASPRHALSPSASPAEADRESSPLYAHRSTHTRPQVAYKTGDESKAREMAPRLDPNHVTEEQMRATWGSGAGPQRKARKPQKS